MGDGFANKGRLSRAWWLLQIKVYGSRGGIGLLSGLLDMSPITLKPYIDLLVGGRYVDMVKTPGGMLNVAPNGNLNESHFSYQLTSLGHRYLNEHRDELEGANLPDDELSEPNTQPEPTPTTHKVVPTLDVPDAKFPTEREPRQTEKPATATPNPHCHVCTRWGRACVNHGGQPSPATFYRRKSQAKTEAKAKPLPVPDQPKAEVLPPDQPDMTCEVCGDKFSPERVVRRYRHAFCSQECLEKRKGTPFTESHESHEPAQASAPAPPDVDLKRIMDGISKLRELYPDFDIRFEIRLK